MSVAARFATVLHRHRLAFLCLMAMLLMVQSSIQFQLGRHLSRMTFQVPASNAETLLALRALEMSISVLTLLSLLLAAFVYLRVGKTRLQQSEARFSAIFRSSPVPMAITTTDPHHPRFLEANPAYLELVGYSWDELRAKSLVELGIAIPCSERDTRLDLLGQQERYGLRAAQIRTADGEVRDVLITAQRTRIEQHEYDVEILLDVTWRKQCETYAREIEVLRDSVRQEVEHSQRVKATLSTLSHDLRNPLAVIATSKDLMTHYADRMSAEQRQDKLDTIGRQLEEMQHLLGDLRDLSKV